MASKFSQNEDTELRSKQLNREESQAVCGGYRFLTHKDFQYFVEFYEFRRMEERKVAILDVPC